VARVAADWDEFRKLHRQGVEVYAPGSVLEESPTPPSPPPPAPLERCRFCGGGLIRERVEYERALRTLCLACGREPNRREQVGSQDFERRPGQQRRRGPSTGGMNL
jgi:hypothetical protein